MSDNEKNIPEGWEERTSRSTGKCSSEKWKKSEQRRVYATNIPRSNDGENIPKEYIFHVEFFLFVY